VHLQYPPPSWFRWPCCCSTIALWWFGFPANAHTHMHTHTLPNKAQIVVCNCALAHTLMLIRINTTTSGAATRAHLPLRAPNSSAYLAAPALTFLPLPRPPLQGYLSPRKLRPCANKKWYTRDTEWILIAFFLQLPFRLGALFSTGSLAFCLDHLAGWFGSLNDFRFDSTACGIHGNLLVKSSWLFLVRRLE